MKKTLPTTYSCISPKTRALALKRCESEFYFIHLLVHISNHQYVSYVFRRLLGILAEKSISKGIMIYPEKMTSKAKQARQKFMLLGASLILYYCRSSEPCLKAFGWKFSMNLI